VTRAALCAGRGTAFARSLAPHPGSKSGVARNTALPPHSRFFREPCNTSRPHDPIKPRRHGIGIRDLRDRAGGGKSSETRPRRIRQTVATLQTERGKIRHRNLKADNIRPVRQSLCAQTERFQSRHHIPPRNIPRRQSPRACLKCLEIRDANVTYPLTRFCNQKPRFRIISAIISISIEIDKGFPTTIVCERIICSLPSYKTPIILIIYVKITTSRTTRTIQTSDSSVRNISSPQINPHKVD